MKTIAFVLGAVLLIGNANHLIEIQQATSAQGVGFNLWLVGSSLAGVILIIWAVKKPSK